MPLLSLLRKEKKSLQTANQTRNAKGRRNLFDHFIKPVYRETKCAEIITSNPNFYLYVFEVGVTVAQAILKEMLASEMYEPIHREIEILINAEKKDSNKNNT